MLSPSDCTVRRAGPDDLPFVYSSWIRCHLRQNSNLSKDAFCALQHRRIERVLEDGGQVHILCGVPDSDWIWGWICTEWDPDSQVFTLHYALTKRDDRGEGVFSRLLQHALPREAARLIYTHRSQFPAFDRKLESWGFQFHPEASK